jgi:hypothetical protein
LNYIVSANVKRRQLTPGQRAMFGADLEPEYAQPRGRPEKVRDSAPLGKARDLEPEYAKTAKQRMSEGGKQGKQNPAYLGQARDQAAAAVGSTGQAVSQAKLLKDNATDLAADVRSGKPLDAAYREYKKHIADQPKPAWRW